MGYLQFESDVILYSDKTSDGGVDTLSMFESDVILYSDKTTVDQNVEAVIV